MQNQPLISIIVPIYNAEKYIGTCFESLLCQTYENIEIIAVDDGSKDNSAETIKKYSEKDSRIVGIFKENGGVTSARLAGIKVSRGEYIGFVDGDDTVDEDMYMFLYENIKKYDADISHCGFKMIFGDGRVNYFHNTGAIIEQGTKKGVEDLLDGSIVEPGLCNKLFHAELLRDFIKEDKMDKTIKNNEDLLMNYHLFCKAQKSVFEDKCKYNYIIHQNSASRGKLNDNRIFDPIKVKKIILDDCSEDLKTSAQRAYINTAVYSYASLLTYEKNEYKEQLKRIRSIILDNYEYCKLLPKRTALLCKMIAKTPRLFSVIYPIYAKKLQKGKYD